MALTLTGRIPVLEGLARVEPATNEKQKVFDVLVKSLSLCLDQDNLIAAVPDFNHDYQK